MPITYTVIPLDTEQMPTYWKLSGGKRLQFAFVILQLYFHAIYLSHIKVWCCHCSLTEMTFDLSPKGPYPLPSLWLHLS